MDKTTVCIVDGVLYVNAENRALIEHPDRLAYWQHKKGFWSTDDLSHPFFHATGHEEDIRATVRKMEQAGLYTPGDPKNYKAWSDRYHGFLETRPVSDYVNIPVEFAEKVLKEVGRQALVSTADFTAEMYAALLVGRLFSRDVIRFYHQRMQSVAEVPTEGKLEGEI